ncbi:hypothetical protein PG997_008613 [Apiospora hydei]|uniref:Stc1 domain-containing protein n=1 Tax=Apiospora hydei TaxID=1337664 RepID=A0ABR1WEA5_9PEZI
MATDNNTAPPSSWPSASPPAPGGTPVPVSEARSAVIARRRELESSRYAQGLCIKCGFRPRDGTTKNCRWCKDRHYETQKRKFSKYKAASRCRKCGSDMPEGGTTLSCARCRASMLRYDQERQNKALEDGVCTKCCQRPPLAGRFWCEACQDRERRRRRKGKGRGTPLPGTTSRRSDEKRSKLKETVERVAEMESMLDELRDSGGHKRMDMDLGGDEEAHIEARLPTNFRPPLPRHS